MIREEETVRLRYFGEHPFPPDDPFYHLLDIYRDPSTFIFDKTELPLGMKIYDLILNGARKIDPG